MTTYAHHLTLDNFELYVMREALHHERSRWEANVQTKPEIIQRLEMRHFDEFMEHHFPPGVFAPYQVTIRSLHYSLVRNALARLKELWTARAEAEPWIAGPVLSAIDHILDEMIGNMTMTSTSSSCWPSDHPLGQGNAIYLGAADKPAKDP